MPTKIGGTGSVRDSIPNRAQPNTPQIGGHAVQTAPNPPSAVPPPGIGGGIPSVPIGQRTLQMNEDNEDHRELIQELTQQLKLSGSAQEDSLDVLLDSLADNLPLPENTNHKPALTNAELDVLWNELNEDPNNNNHHSPVVPAAANASADAVEREIPTGVLGPDALRALIQSAKADASPGVSANNNNNNNNNNPKSADAAHPPVTKQ
ncbi:MAG: hypothetical protein U1F68_00400 [Gammaproteobacteria bacterium]